MSTPKLEDALQTLVSAIQSALAAAGAPGKGQVYIGWPTGPEETQKLGQPDIEGSVTVYPTHGQDVTRYLDGGPIGITKPVVNLVATVASNTVTFSGASDVAYNIHAFVAGHGLDAYYPTTASESLANVATGVAAAINNLAIAGVTAAAAGAVVTLTGAQFTVVNIGGTGAIAVEQRRTRQMVQVSVWINDFIARWAIVDAIMLAIGTVQSHFLTLSDGSQAYIEYQSDRLDDSSESSYSVAAHHIIYAMEFGLLQTVPAYQIGSVELEQQMNALPQTTAYFGNT